jgi:hypothetical protein
MEEEFKHTEQAQPELPPQEVEQPPSSPSADVMEDNVGAPSPDQSIE